MAVKDISKFFVYRWRYILGYSLIGLLLAALLFFVGLFVPGGLSSAEIDAATRSAAIAFDTPSTLAIASLPYYMIQATFFHFFGISDLTIKLPSIILALISAVGLVFLLRRWFTQNIAVLASLVAITTGQFLFVAQTGTDSILYIFWPVVLLLLGTQITRNARWSMLWKVLFVIAAALSLYTPLSIYPLLAVALTTALHPHLRNAVRRLSKSHLAICAAIGLVLLAPLIFLLTVSPSLGATLLGIQVAWPIDLGANVSLLLGQYLLFWEPSTTNLMTPVFGLGSVLIIGLGLYRIIRTYETTRSYLLLIWSACLIPVLLINPVFVTVLFVPAVLLIAAGLTSLITYWYQLFPRNPYARIAGLIPLIILIGTLSISGLDRYMFGYHYNPNTAANFSKDLRLLPGDTTTLIVAPEEQPFYESVAKYNDSLIVVTTIPENIDQFTTTHETNASYDGYTVERIVTNSYSNDSDRFYLYQKTEK